MTQRVNYNLINPLTIKMSTEIKLFLTELSASENCSPFIKEWCINLLTGKKQFIPSDYEKCVAMDFDESNY